MTLIDELLEVQFPSKTRISPNAQQVVYSTSVVNGHYPDGQHALSTIWLADTGIAQSARRLTSGLFNDRNAEWCPDGQSISFVSDRAKLGESSAIYVMPVQSTGEAHPLTPTESESVISQAVWSPGGKTIAYISADEKTPEKKLKEEAKDDAHVWGEDWSFGRLRLVHVTTKKITTLVNLPAHVSTYAWSDDGTRIACITTETPDIESKFIDGSKISIVDVDSGRIEQVCAFPRDIFDLAWTGNFLYFTAALSLRSIISSVVVYSVDLDSDKKTYQKIAHGESDDAGYSFRKCGRDIVVAVLRDMDTDIRMLNGRTILSSKGKEFEAWDAAFTTDSDEMILTVAQGDTNNPAEVFTTTASGGAWVQLSDHGAAVKNRIPRFGNPKFISCESKSLRGEAPVRIDGIFVAPHGMGVSEDRPQQPLPTVVCISGGPYGRCVDQFNPTYYMWTPLFLSEGYAILTVNYRGSSGRGEDFAALAWGGMGHDLSDVVEIVNHAILEGLIDKEKIVVSGWSQGGHMSYLACTRNGEHNYGWKFKAAIPGAGVTDWDAITMTSDLGATGEAQLVGEVPWKLEKGDMSGRKGSALWEFAAAAKKGIIPPVLILHGEQDMRVPIEQARAFRRALQDAKLPFQYVTYPREGHTFHERKHMADMMERVLRFVDLHIGSN